MATAITTGASVIRPAVLRNIAVGRDSQSNVHPITGRAEPDVTLRPATTRSGQLELGFTGPNSERDSATAEAVLAGAGVFTIVTDDAPTLAFSFVLDGRLERELEAKTLAGWTLTVGYREVTA